MSGGSGVGGRGSGDSSCTLGVFGGTFDPPHLGHLAAAQEAMVEYGLSRVLFVPAGQNPLKLDERISDLSHRFEMTRLAIAGNAGFEISDADVCREGPTFTIDLLVRLRQQLGSRVKLAFIVGMDVLHELHLWREPARILELASLIAVTRPGQAPLDPTDLESRVPGAGRRVHVVNWPGVAISSTELRARVALGKPIRYLVPDVVAAYIVERGLYRQV